MLISMKEQHGKLKMACLRIIPDSDEEGINFIATQEMTI